MFAVVMLSSASVAAVAAPISRTNGGYATGTSTRVTACDTRDDGHQIEGQSHHVSGVRGLVRDNAGGSCTSNTYGSKVTEFRACLLDWFDECGPWVKP